MAAYKERIPEVDPESLVSETADELQDMEPTPPPVQYFTLGPLRIEESRMKSISCIVMIVQAVTLVIAMKSAQSVPKDKRFINSTAVVLSECLKLIVCSFIVFSQQTSPNEPFFSRLKRFYELILGDKRAIVLISIPSTLYALQNNLTFIAVSNLPATVYQILAQLKVLTTAIFSILILGRSITGYKWFSLVVLMTGVAIVQSGGASSSSSETSDPVAGFVAVLMGCVTSGFSGVFLEKMLKDPTITIWQRNVQLALIGVISASLMALAKDSAEVAQRGFFAGYSPLVAAVVVNHALGGLVVALVVKYADNLIKGFAVSLSIIISAVISIALFGASITLALVVGGALVLISSYMYSQPDSPSSSSSSSSSSSGAGAGAGAGAIEMTTRQQQAAASALAGKSGGYGPVSSLTPVDVGDDDLLTDEDSHRGLTGLTGGSSGSGSGIMGGRGGSGSGSGRLSPTSDVPFTVGLAETDVEGDSTVASVA